MSVKKVDAEIVWKQCTNDASIIDEIKIIDLSAFDFDDTDRWLYIPTGCQMESTVYNLCTWFKSEPEAALSVCRRSIDTRTFTRPKKRCSKVNFESIFKTLPPTVTNTWESSCSDFSNIEEDLSKYSDVPTANKKDSVPPMLKMASTIDVDLPSNENIITSGQESMEAFLNMSCSKGIDSFINLVEPGVVDSLMNVSQPSIFHSSIISLPKDDYLHNPNCDKEEESTNLTHSYIHQADQHENSKISSIDKTFSKVETDNNKSYCVSSANETFTNESYIIEKTELNETYNAEAISKTFVMLNLDKDKSGTTNSSSTFVNKENENMKLLQPENAENEELHNLNITYVPTCQDVKNSPSLDATYSTAEAETANKDITLIIKADANKYKDQGSDIKKNTVFNVPENLIDSSASFSFIHNNVLDSTFKLSVPLYNQSTPKNLTPLNSTFKTTNKNCGQSGIYNTVLGSNFNVPTLLRRELLAEVHRSGDRKIDCCTFNQLSNDFHDGKAKEEVINEASYQNIKNDIPEENKYNTYKKVPSIHILKPQTEVVSEFGVQNTQDRKYYTFTKKANAHAGKVNMENIESVENVDATFVKPLPKLQKRKQHIPRMLSKLPQFLQKSNPNLLSNSLKTVNATGCVTASGIGYKGSQPNIMRDVEKNLANKLYPLGKMKSGSEQRLVEFNTGVGELQMMGAGGSTESIESTQSAHSAPDLDDRLSTCSDSSHNSYTVQPMNIEQLHRIVQMQEESLKQDATPRLNRKVLENAWIDTKKDLPSPILKNGVDSSERNPSSRLNIDYTIRTSSPILSLTKSSQSIHTDGHSRENAFKHQSEIEIEKKIEVSNKLVMKVENKTKLRQPTNWNTGSKVSNVMSAIPRPASRIPAPRFIRPTVKPNIQGDVKKGYV